MINKIKITDSEVFSKLPARKPDSNKGSYGTLTCICGSVRYRGAAALSVSAALRCGTGIVRLASVEKVVDSTSAKLSECIFEPLTSNDEGSISAENSEKLLCLVKNSSAVLCGCGMTMCRDTAEIVKALIESYQGQLILDADALNSISGFLSPDILKSAAKIPVITPHIGEMSRLCGKTITGIKESRLETAEEFSYKYGCITVLKDNLTHIAAPDSNATYISTAGNAGLARGGSGDLLAGMIASLCAQGISPKDAAICGVHLHGKAADRCAERLSMRGMLPSDILYDLCGIFKELE